MVVRFGWPLPRSVDVSDRSSSHFLLLRLSVIAAPLATAACFGSSSTSNDAGFTFPDTGAMTFEAGASDTGATDAAQTKTDAGPQDAGTTDSGPNPGAAIYVTNQNNAVTAFALDATGNVAPVRTLSGATTQLSLPIGVTVDAQGEVMVANRQGGNVTVYAPLANGNVAPSRTLTATGMGSPQGLALGPTGDLFVSTCPNCGPANGGNVGVFHFPPMSAQSDSSIAGADAGLTDPGSIQLDESQNLWVANAFGGDVALFPAGSSGNATPTRSFTPMPATNIQSLGYGGGTLFVTAPSVGVELFASTTSGSASPAATLAGSMLPLSYPGGVFIDSSTTPPTVFLVDYSANAVYLITTTGTAPNLAIGSVVTIQGAATLLSGPLGIFVAR
jgi:hypothetical protein